MLAIIDYGMGNLCSVQKALESLGYQVVITTARNDLRKAGGIILPGVGAFADAAARLSGLGLNEAIIDEVSRGKPLLGICLGLQLLFETSEENGHHQGLGLIKGHVRRLRTGLKVPHMGWNQVAQQNNSPLFRGIPDNTPYYFVHSYYVEPAEAGTTIGRADYGGCFTCAVGQGLIFGVQFHPEKSSKWGLKMLSNFGDIVGEKTRAKP